MVKKSMVKKSMAKKSMVKKSMVKKSMVLLLIVAILSLTACTVSDSAVQTKSNEEVHIFVDDCNREVSVPNEINSIVASGPLSQVVLVSLAPECFAGLASKFDSRGEGIISDEMFKLPYFGQLYGKSDLNVEELAVVNPQLVIDIGESKNTIVEDMDTLETQTGIPSVHIEATLKTLPDAYRRLGTLLGKEEKAEELAQSCENIYSRTLSIMEKVGDNKVDALYILGQDGMNVLAKDAFQAQIFDLLTNNVAVVDSPTSKGTGNEVTMEQIAQWNPEFILFAPDSVYSTVAEDEVWKELDAVKSGNYVEAPIGPYNWMGTPISVQSFLGMIWLPALLYPQYCDYDLKTQVKEYYKTFYEYELTDEKYDLLTRNAFVK